MAFLTVRIFIFLLSFEVEVSFPTRGICLFLGAADVFAVAVHCHFLVGWGEVARRAEHIGDDFSVGHRSLMVIIGKSTSSQRSVGLV